MTSRALALFLWAALTLTAAAQSVSSPGAGDAAAAPASSTLTLRVLADDGAPAAGANVRLVGTPRHAVTGADGDCRFEDLPPGRYVVSAQSARFGEAVLTLDLGAGQNLAMDLRVDLSVHSEEISVTAAAEPRALDELVSPVSVLADRDLLVAARPTLGETLASEPGVTHTFFGAGASRPVIRGLGGDRIRVLESGLGTGDASTTSPDHAVTFDPLSADEVEVVRGPATLLYGSSAIGGVVNLIDRTVPSFVPEEPVTGSVTLQGGTAAEGAAGSIVLSGGGSRFAWHLEGYRRDDGDYSSGDGEVPNSFVEGEGGNVGASWVGADGYLGAGYGHFESDYGNPGEPEAPVTIDMESDRWDLSGSLQRAIGPFRSVDLRVGGTDYQHRELEGEETGTLFLNDSLEGRVELAHRPLGPLAGTLGVQYGSRDFSAIGEEAFVPPTETESLALFLLEEAGGERLRVQFGARYEAQENRADPFPDRDGGESADPPDRDFSGLSGSVGLLWNPGEVWGVALSLARSVKLPNAEELYSDGPHIATGAYEIGDPNLDEEVSLGADLALRKRSGRLTGRLTLFVNRFDGFIFESFTDEFVGGDEEGEGGGEEEEPLRVVRFEQRDADFRGAELDAHFELLHRHPHHLELEAQADYVRAEDRTTGDPLPRIPPLRWGLGLRYSGERWIGNVRWQRVEEQDRISDFETPTPGYDTLTASVGYRFFAGRTVHDLILTGSNLTDELAYNHVSFLKDVAPLPGRDVRLTYRMSF